MSACVSPVSASVVPGRSSGSFGARVQVNERRFVRWRRTLWVGKREQWSRDSLDRESEGIDSVTLFNNVLNNVKYAELKIDLNLNKDKDLKNY